MSRINYEHPADQIVRYMKRIYDYGMTTTSGGNLSILDENGDMWISPSGVDKGTLTPADIMCVKADGTIIGKHKPSCEYPFHQGIYKARPEARAVVHAHPPMLVAWSLAKIVPGMSIIPGAKDIVEAPGMAGYGCPGSQILGDKIRAEFAKGYKALLLENHGAVVCGTSLADAFRRFETYDYTARIASNANLLGGINNLSDDEIAEALTDRNGAFTQVAPTQPGVEELAIRKTICDMTRRAYRQKLFTCADGTCAIRTKDGFIMTSKNADRGDIQPDELIAVKGTEYSGDMGLENNTWLVKKIFDEQPELNALIFAHPAAMTAYGAARVTFDTRLIPESYLLLREMPAFDFGTDFRTPEKITQTISPRMPVVLVKNDFILTAGANLLQALDRLEVAEYSAQGAITASKLGDLKLMGDDAIQDIITAFNLIP
ncbi:MAG: class II aldolase/adducin family protein [Lentisphaeria bacterium]|nr:class II aldolase/adducin family protein [Lentisphaeria bacterium]